MTPEDWEAKGYKRFQSGHKFKLEDFGLQKRIDDEKGKKYFITVYVYDRSRYPDFPLNTNDRWGFMPELYFNRPDDLISTTTTMHLHNHSIEQVEEEAEKLWVHFGSYYAEKWEA